MTEELIYLARHLKNSLRINLSIYEQGTVLFSTLSMVKNESVLSLGNYFTEKYSEKEAPILFLEYNQIYFFCFCDDAGRFFVIGPVSIGVYDEQILSVIRTQFGLPANYPIPILPTFQKMLNDFCLSYYVFNKQILRETDILRNSTLSSTETNYVSEQSITSYKFNTSNEGLEHFGFDYEQELLEAIREGNVDYFQNKNYEYYQEPKTTGKLADTATKQQEYELISLIVLVSRAAIRGGLNPSVAYSVSEIYCQKVARATSSITFFEIAKNVQLDFAHRVQQEQLQKKQKDLIEQTKNYIWCNIFNGNVTVGNIAKHLAVNQSHLSRKFKSKTGKTISIYIMECRMIQAAQMLKYTTRPIVEIMDSLNFSSQSHFGKCFKEHFGETPSEFRNKRQVF